MSSLQRHLRALEARVTDQPAEAFERVLVCGRCKAATAVFECSQFSADLEGWTDAQTFVCLRCDEFGGLRG